MLLLVNRPASKGALMIERNSRSAGQSLRQLDAILDRDDVRSGLAAALRVDKALIATAGRAYVGECKQKTPFGDLYQIMLNGKTAYTCTHRPSHTSDEKP